MWISEAALSFLAVYGLIVVIVEAFRGLLGVNQWWSGG